MSGNVFVDTNIFVYAQVSGDGSKNASARELLEKSLFEKNVIISTQVLGEVYSAMSKHKKTHAEISRLLDKMIQDSNIVTATLTTVQAGLKIIEKYGYSYWDSLLLATAIENDCEVIYSEDMRHNQIVEDKLRILNPFAD